MAVRAVPFPPPPPGDVLCAVPAPGFATRPPRLRNAGLVPPAERAAMQPAWGWGDYPPTEVRLHRLRDVTLAAEGLVFLPGGELAPASLTQHDPAEVEAARAAIAAAGALPELAGPHVLCVKRGATNYGHWLAEMLPVALLAQRLLGPGLRFLVPPAGGALGAAIRDSLALAGIGAERLVPLHYDAPVRVGELVMAHGLSLHGTFLSPVVAEALQAMAAEVPASAPGCKLWVSRAGWPRSLWQEDKVAAVLADMGWRVVEPGSLPFAGQVALFKGAARVAGVMGAGLANLLFAPPDARVDVFAPANMPDTFFWLIAALRGLDYHEARCWQTSQPLGPAPWDTGLVLPLPDLLAALGAG